MLLVCEDERLVPNMSSERDLLSRGIITSGLIPFVLLFSLTSLSIVLGNNNSSKPTTEFARSKILLWDL